MQNLKDLFDFILQTEASIVFGNLGRYLNVLAETLLSIPAIQVIIVTTDTTYSSADNRIRLQRPTEPINQCDLLLYAEPANANIIQVHPNASHVAIFTSHFTFRTETLQWTLICYFHAADIGRIQSLLERQDFPIQTRNVGLVEGDHSNALTLSNRPYAAPQAPDTYAIINLTQYSHDPLDLYLALWNAFDFLVEHQDMIRNWVICFPEKGRKDFQTFVRKVLNYLLCVPFNLGNRTDRREIMLTLPFYGSGKLDLTFNTEVSDFGGIPFAAPKTIEDACKMALQYDILHLANNVYWINP